RKTSTVVAPALLVACGSFDCVVTVALSVSSPAAVGVTWRARSTPPWAGTVARSQRTWAPETAHGSWTNSVNGKEKVQVPALATAPLPLKVLVANARRGMPAPALPTRVLQVSGCPTRATSPEGVQDMLPILRSADRKS